MNNKIYILTDYLNRFESKHNSDIYKNGMDKELLSKEFKKYNFDVKYIPFHKIKFDNKNWTDSNILYGSQEDVGHYYKSFIEDVVLGLQLAGANLIPSYKYLRAHSNKVFMELLRSQMNFSGIQTLKTNWYGCIEELPNNLSSIKFPVVVKGAEGAMSSNVSLAKNSKELSIKVKKLSATRNLIEEARESIRSYKYDEYRKQSKYRKKFILQEFLPDLKNDWKVLVFGDKYYIFERKVRKNDFRASGSGQNQYLYGSDSSIPNGIFSVARQIRKELDIPMVSLDFAKYLNQLYLIEFQALYFGTVGQWKSDVYYEIKDGEVFSNKNDYSLEEIYVESVVKYLKDD